MPALTGSAPMLMKKPGGATMKKPAQKKQPSGLDKFIAQRVRLCRRAKGITQDDLAKALGITFQQIQKYETGRNRISAGRLAEIASILQMPLETFYAGTDELRLVFARPGKSVTLRGQPDEDLCELIAAYIDAASATMRKKIMRLALAAAHADDTRD